jgi:hypothetical protein
MYMIVNVLFVAFCLSPTVTANVAVSLAPALFNSRQKRAKRSAALELTAAEHQLQRVRGYHEIELATLQAARGTVRHHRVSSGQSEQLYHCSKWYRSDSDVSI